MGRLNRTLTSLLPLALAILALCFSLLATTSREWASQNTYTALAPQDWTTPAYTKYRSPFVICRPNNGTGPGSALDCVHFSVFDFNGTGCESSAVTRNDNVAQVGDARLCQQLHFAGNLAIASTGFIGVGCLLTLLMASAAVALTTGSIRTDSDAFATTSQHYYQYHPSRDKISVFTPYINLSLILLLAVGGVLYVLAQFYGVIGLVQSQPDNGSFAASWNPDSSGDHEPWIQGKALTVYASIAWLASLLAAASAALAWRLPGGEKVF
ncbi:MAG: hypothetical protein M1839_002171 [Geoglossum umbratile]|nr:MAG: hypothetical protein M1839_002171 [Geoglossum umbratile]